MDIAELGLVVRSDGVVIAGKRLKDFKKDATDTDRAVGFLNNTFTKLASLAGVVAGSFLAKGLIDYTSAWSDLSERVDLATGRMGHAPEVMGRIEAMARRTYSSLGNTADSYLKNANALRDLGLSTNQALDFTESLNNAMVISGAKADQAASVQNALSKAMGLGKLSGEDLNTILERGGRIAQLLAEELGTTTLGLRAMGAEGKITSDVIQRTLLGNLEKLREEADGMAATMLDGFQLIGNSIFAFVGRVDQAVGAGENMASMLVAIADGITAATDPTIAALNMLIDNADRLIIIGGTFAAVWGAQYVAAMVAAHGATTLLVGGLTLLRGALIRTGIGALVVLAGELVYQLYNVVDGSSSVGEAFDRLKTSGVQTWERLVSGGEYLWHSLVGIAKMIEATFTNAWAGVLSGFGMVIKGVQDGYNAIATTFGQAPIDFGFQAIVDGQAQLAAQRYQEGLDSMAAARKSFDAMFEDKSGVPGTSNGGLIERDKPGGSSNALNTPGVPPSLGAGGGGAAAKLNEYQQLTKSIKEQTEALGWEAQAIGMSNMEADKFNKTMELLRAAKEAGIPITSDLTDEINGLANGFAVASERSREMQRNMQNMEQLNSAIASGFADVFTSIIDGSKTAGEAIGDLLMQLGKLLINQAFNSLFQVGGGGGGLLGGLLGGLFSFDGGGKTPSGPRSGGVDGKGGFLSILHPDETVIDHTKGGPANDNGGRGDLYLSIDGSNLTEAQMRRAIADALQTYDSSLARKVEGKVRVMQTDPRAADGNW